MLKKLFVPFLIIILIVPILGAETVTKDNFAEPEILINGKTYIQNETFFIFDPNVKINLYYEIKPKTDEDAKIIDDRDYDIFSDLSDVKITYAIYIKETGGVVKGKGNSIDVDDLDWAGGVLKIKINLTGYTPQIDERIEYLYVVKIKVQDGGYVLPNVLIYVKNDELFLSDLKDAKGKYNEISNFLTNYTGKVDVSNLKRYLDFARNNLTLAEGNLNERDYISADKYLSYAESWLKKAKEESFGIESRYLYSLVDKRIDTLGGKLNEIKVYIDEIEKKALVNTTVLIDYKVRYNSLRDKMNDLIGSLAKIGGYIDIGKYEDAKNHLKSLMNELSNVERLTSDLLKELKSILNVKPTTPTSTTQSLRIDWNVLGFYVGIIGGCIVIALILTVTLKRYIRRRRWDELK